MSSTSKQQQCSSLNWKCPEPVVSEARVYLYNSCTKKKELFTAIQDNNVTWYHCDTTVHNEHNISHARSLVSLDIIRRVLAYYFHCSISYWLNLTDIDEKIIKQARDEHLLQDYQIVLQYVKDVRERETDKDKQDMYDKQISTIENSFQFIDALSDVETKQKKLFDDCGDILSSYMGFNYSYLKTSPLDNQMFLNLAYYYETNFFKYMEKLHIEFPNVSTCVSRSVPKIIEFITGLIANGYAYESNSSVYFDTLKFAKQHSSVELEHDRTNDVAGLSEGEDKSASITSNEKKNKCDFVLWKKHEAGEPFWQSSWGDGRPGKDIGFGCGVLDVNKSTSHPHIHTGTIIHPWLCDVQRCWHLTIADDQESKSVKHDGIIQQLLEKYGSRQIRLLFLLHSWLSTFDYSDYAMQEAADYEQMLITFFDDVQKHLHSIDQSNRSNAHTKSDEHNSTLNECFLKLKNKIHLALCDSIDTPTVLQHIHDLVSTTNIYMNTSDVTKDRDRLLLRKIALYITKFMNIFGLNYPQSYQDDIGFIQQSTETSAIHKEDDVVIPPNEEIISSTYNYLPEDI